ncbi:zinc finger and BTB domain-containing protein 10-like isoform X1 [Acipenser oxyrinchus oxyrinchus]|uniref:Zinc finger and BTB domain-containing protein 10-like isoform X1 n=1 Tax=Acipenser oxyrinchus oxyrinchus TaxID=40147 RepID=A0AAD8LRU7_ACIOX|nr:zinc finger and BTB domain-containing protein 10-like isoform X1 [Acipenser oxyrinchus oxyrinchus]
MSGERNRRSLAFRGGGLAATGCSASGISSSNSNSNSEEAQVWQERHLNGNRPEQDEKGGLEEKRSALEGVEDGVSISDSTGPEAEEEEDEDAEGDSWAAGNGVDEGVGIISGDSRVSLEAGDDGQGEGGSWGAGNGFDDVDGVGVGSGSTVSGEDDRERASGVDGEETGGRKSGLEMKPQTLLQKHCLFQGSWLQEFSWLHFCQETGLMSCSWCHNTGSSCNDELAKGSRNYKRALLLRHHLFADHKKNDPSKQESEKGGESVDEEYDSYRTKPNENSYCYQLLQELNEQRKKGILCDVNIVVSGQVFRAHKNILVAGSRFFKTLYCLTKNESCDQTTITHLDIAAVQGFSVILDFLYSGNLLLTSQNAIDVMSVASYLQMTEVVQSCRAFIKDALNISIKSEAPDSVVVDYNRRRSINKDGKGSEKKPSNFWATSILSKLSIKASSHMEDPSDLEESINENSGWANDNSSESTENEPQGHGTVFVWNETATHTPRKEIKQEPGSGRRKNQATRRFVYNIPPEPEEGFEEFMLVQPSASYSKDDLQFLSENAELTNQIQYSLLQETQPREIKNERFNWENDESSAVNKLKCPHCNYIAKHRRTLKRHLIIHSGVRSFSCDICGKLFTRREHVKRHSLVHKKDKKYKCMVCKKIFMLAASVGIRHGSRRYGVCVDCADSHQGSQEGLDQMQDLEFSREDDYEEIEVGEEDLGDEGEEQIENDQSPWDKADASNMSVNFDDKSANTDHGYIFKTSFEGDLLNKGPSK